MKNATQWNQVTEHNDLGEEVTSISMEESLWEDGRGGFRIVRHSYERQAGGSWEASPEAYDLGYSESKALMDRGTLRGVAHYRDITPETAMREAVSAMASESLAHLLHAALDKAGIPRG
jgi:hypothetical protein